MANETFTRTFTATFAGGAATSDVVDLTGFKGLALLIPAGFNGTWVKLQATDTLGGTFYPVFNDDGGEVTLQVAAGRIVVADVAAPALSALRYIKLVSSVAQAGGGALVTVIAKF